MSRHPSREHDTRGKCLRNATTCPVAQQSFVWVHRALFVSEGIPVHYGWLKASARHTKIGEASRCALMIRTIAHQVLNIEQSLRCFRARVQ
jgi:hypothetical protein